MTILISVDARHLQRDGHTHVLGSRAFDVLLALLAQPGQVLSKDELLARAWRGRVVEENNLATQIGSLRRLLGAEAIATVPGHGYQWTLHPVQAEWREGQLVAYRVGEAAAQAAASQAPRDLASPAPGLARDYWHLADAAWLHQHSPQLPTLRIALAEAERTQPARAGRLLADACFLFLQLGLAAEARQAWWRLDSTGALAPERLPAGDAAASEDAAWFALAGSRLHWGLDPAHVQALAERALALVPAPVDAAPSDAAFADAAATAVDGPAALCYQAQRMRLGSGGLDAAQAQQALAQMQALEQPTWPHRLRAQRLLAQLDHLGQWQAGATAPQGSAARADAPGTGSPATGPAPLPSAGPPEVLAQLQQLRSHLRTLAEAAGLDTLGSLARIGLAESHLWAGRWVDARGAARSLLAPGAPALPGNQALLAQAVQLAAELAWAHEALCSGNANPSPGPTVSRHLEAATHSLHALLARSAGRGWEWLEAQAALAAWWAALQAHAVAGDAAPLATAHALANLAARLQPAGPLIRWLHWLAAAGAAARQGLPPATGDEPWLEDGPALGAHLGLAGAALHTGPDHTPGG